MQNNSPVRIIPAKKMRVGIVVARFNTDYTSGLLSSALAYLKTCDVAEANIGVVEVAGAAELPSALQKLAHMKKYDCLVALGCIIRGETPHFDYVCAMAQQGILRVSLDYRLPIGFGLITVNSPKQAAERLHLGAEAAAAALEVALL